MFGAEGRSLPSGLFQLSFVAGALSRLSAIAQRNYPPFLSTASQPAVPYAAVRWVATQPSGPG